MSDKTIVQKLLIKPGQRVLFVNAPLDYVQGLTDLPPDVTLLPDGQGPADVVQIFARSQQELETQLAPAKALLAPKGILWITYYKGTAKVKTDINRDTIAAYANTIGLQAVFIFSVDDNWSALRVKIA